MRILLAAGIYPPDPGGPALHAQAFYNWVRSTGGEPGLVAMSHYRKWPPLIRHLIYFSQLVRRVPYFDVVYTYDALGTGIPAYLAARAKGKKLVVRIGGDIPWERYAEASSNSLSMNEWYERGLHKRNIRFILSKWMLEKAEAIIVPSPLLAHLLRRYYGVEMKAIIIIPNPAPAVVAVPETKHEETIVFASRLVAYKNLDTLIRALKPLMKDNKRLRLVVIGDGPERERLEALSKSLGVSGQIDFTGVISQSEVMEYTSKCLLVVAPALTEFNPNYILQGVGLGKPFLISRENGLTFTVPDEFMFDARDTEMLKEKLVYLLSEEGSRSAREKVRNLQVPAGWTEVMEANWKVVESLNIIKR